LGRQCTKGCDLSNGRAQKERRQTVHKLTIKGEVPVDGFWSITVYGADGYLHKNDQDSYSFNNVTAKKDADGSVTIQFGGCDALPLTVYRSPPAGTMGCVSIAREKKSSMELGSSRRRGRSDIFPRESNS
jgi:hypothetical protein